jgi:adenylosuccinate lyase
MLALAAHTGKQTAHQIVYEVAQQAAAEDRPLLEALLADARVMAHLSEAELRDLFDYTRHVGHCRDFVDRVTGLALPEAG